MRAATALDAAVDVLFCDDALLALRQGVVNAPAWSAIYSNVLPGLTERLRDAEFVTMEPFLRDAREQARGSA